MSKRLLLSATALFVACAIFGGLAACGGGNTGSDSGSGTSSEENENVNIYGGEGDFVFSKWQAQSDSVYTEITKNEDGSTFLRWVKSASQDNMCGIFSEVGNLPDSFRYVNVTVSGIEGKTMMLRLGDSTVSSLVLGADKIVEVSEDTQTFSYEISADNAWMLNSVKEVYLIAEPGQNSASNVGTMTVHKSWFSEALPEGATVAKASPWANGGNYKITQIGDVTRVSYSAIQASSWQNISMEIPEHSAATQNTLNFTLTNTGTETVYISVKTLEKTNPDESSSLTWDNVVLEAGTSEELKISLSKGIRKICMFVASADNIPSGVYSGEFEISEVTFSYTDPASLCAWQATGAFIAEKGEGKGSFFYTALTNGDWNQNIGAQIEHDPETQNTITLTVANKGDAAAHYYVKAQAADKSEVAGSSFDLEAGGVKTVSLTVNGKVASVIVWINADKYTGEAGAATSGCVELTNPVLSYTEPLPQSPWSGSADYALSVNDKGETEVVFDGVTSNSWRNIGREVSHDVAVQNMLSMTFANTGDGVIYLTIKTVDGDNNQVSWTDVELAAGETKTAAVALEKQIAKIELYICSTSVIPEGTYSGSVMVGEPVFGYAEPEIESPWTGSSVYETSMNKEGVVTVNYEGVKNNTWQNIGRSVSHDFSAANTLEIAFANTGDSKIYIQIKTVDAENNGVTWTDIEMEAGEAKNVSITLGKQIARIELYICSTSNVPEGIYAGSFTMTEPKFSNIGRGA